MKYIIEQSVLAIESMVKCIRDEDKNCLMRINLEECTCSSSR